MTVEPPRFVTFDEVLYVHEQSLARFGGIAGTGNPGLISSGQIAESQAFNDGNKRTGAGSAIMFLKVNGIGFPTDDGSVYSALIDIANKKLDKPGLADVFRKLVTKISEP
jgi:death on curing protein